MLFNIISYETNPVSVAPFERVEADDREGVLVHDKTGRIWALRSLEGDLPQLHEVGELFEQGRFAEILDWIHYAPATRTEDEVSSFEEACAEVQ